MQVSRNPGTGSLRCGERLASMTRQTHRFDCPLGLSGVPCTFACFLDTSSPAEFHSLDFPISTAILPWHRRFSCCLGLAQLGDVA